MYNRYIPQPDGSYRRRSVPDQAPAQPSRKPAPRQPERPQPQPSKENCQPSPPPPPRPNPRQAPPRRNNDVEGFLRQLLPKDFCTEDLIVVLLLLLMAGDTQEGKSNALLTLALYLFL